MTMTIIGKDAQGVALSGRRMGATRSRRRLLDKSCASADCVHTVYVLSSWMPLAVSRSRTDWSNHDTFPRFPQPLIGWRRFFAELLDDQAARHGRRRHIGSTSAVFGFPYPALHNFVSTPSTPELLRIRTARFDPSLATLWSCEQSRRKAAAVPPTESG